MQRVTLELEKNKLEAHGMPSTPLTMEFSWDIGHMIRVRIFLPLSPAITVPLLKD